MGEKGKEVSRTSLKVHSKVGTSEEGEKNGHRGKETSGKHKGPKRHLAIGVSFRINAVRLKSENTERGKKRRREKRNRKNKVLGKYSLSLGFRRSKKTKAKGQQQKVAVKAGKFTDSFRVQILRGKKRLP